MDTELKPQSSARRSWVRFPPRVITLFCLFQGISIYYILHRQCQHVSRVDAKSPKSKLGKILTAKSSMSDPGIEPTTFWRSTVASVQYPFRSLVRSLVRSRDLLFRSRDDEGLSSETKAPQTTTTTMSFGEGESDRSIAKRPPAGN